MGIGNAASCMPALTFALQSKRQYVYELGKWKVKKYKNGSSAKSANARKKSRDELQPANLVPDQDVLKKLYPLVPGTSNIINRDETPELLVLKGDFSSGVSDDDLAFKFYLAIEEKVQNLPPLAKERLLISRARAAETRENAGEVIKSIHAEMSTPASQEESSESLSFTVALYNILLGYVYDRSVDGRKESSGKQQAVAFVTMGMRQLVDENYKLRSGPTKHKVFDMVTYMLLNYGLDVYIASYKPGNEGKPLPKDFKFSILRDFVDHQGLREMITQKAPPTILRECLKWCIEKLEFSSTDRLSQHLADLLQMKCKDCFVLWKADILIYCFLWCKWYEGYAEGHAAPWSQSSMVQLGISFSDLLVTVVWMFMHPEQDASRKKQSGHGATSEQQVPRPSGDHAELKAETKAETAEQKSTKLEGPDQVKIELSPAPAIAIPDPAFVETASRAETLIPLAKGRAQELAKAKENDLWAQALDEFTWLNSHTDLPKEEKEFNQNVFSRTRKFIDELVMAGPKPDTLLPLRPGGRQQDFRGGLEPFPGNGVARSRDNGHQIGKVYVNGVSRGGDEVEEEEEDEEEDGGESGDLMDMEDDETMKDATENDVDLD